MRIRRRFILSHHHKKIVFYLPLIKYRHNRVRLELNFLFWWDCQPKRATSTLESQCDGWTSARNLSVSHRRIDLPLMTNRTIRISCNTTRCRLWPIGGDNLSWKFHAHVQYQLQLTIKVVVTKCFSIHTLKDKDSKYFYIKNVGYPIYTN